MSEKEQYSAEEVGKLGYDLGVVEYFKKVNPGLLGFMWGNGSALYDDVLKNAMSDEELEEKFQGAKAMKPFGNVFDSMKHLIDFRAEGK